MPAEGLWREKRPLFPLSPLPAGQSCQEPAPGFAPKSLAGCASEMPGSTTNPLLVLTETLPKQRRGWRGIAGTSVLARTRPQQGERLGALSRLT